MADLPPPGYNECADESPLPPGWEAQRTEQGEIFYVDHINKVTTWDRPIYIPPCNSTYSFADHRDSPSKQSYLEFNNCTTNQYDTIASSQQFQPPNAASYDSTPVVHLSHSSSAPASVPLSAPITNQQPVSPRNSANEGEGTLILKPKFKSGISIVSSVSILVDGHNVGHLSPKKDLELKVKAGNHTIQGSHGTSSSKPVTIGVTPNTTHVFECIASSGILGIKILFEPKK